MSKTSRLAIVLTAIAASFIVAGAQAAPKTAARKTAKPADMSMANPTESHEPATSSQGETRFGVGFSSVGTTILSAPSLSGMLNLNDKHSIQFLFGIGGTSPFTFATGGFYRVTLSGDENSGFHVGGGLTLGTSGGAVAAAGTSFFINIQPLAGFHFQIPHAPVVLSMDGGPTVAIVGGAANFGIGAFSSLFGLSAHYFF